ncbi:hypothetical protein M5689_001399 [Euphorbia peplus]|nr:hypothetical protein M5689_001399 [Euphorbia peplus]
MGLGISILLLLKATALFIFSLTILPLPFISLPLIYASLISFLLSLASHPYINLPLILGKNTDGTFPIWSLIIFSPYLVFVRIFSLARRFVSGEEPYTEVSDGVFVGGWPFSGAALPPGDPAIVDCTCELPRKPEFKRNSYLCIPTWDTRAPSPGEIEAGVKWVCRKRGLNQPVFIHCAYGHGRSVAVACAVLVGLGVAENWKAAEKMIKEKRPYIRMNSLHRKSLEEWSRHRLSGSSPMRKPLTN